MTKIADEAMLLPDFGKSHPGITHDDLITVRHLQLYYRDSEFLPPNYNNTIWGHERCIITYMLEGCCTVKSGNVTLELNNGDACIIPPLTPHSFPVTTNSKRLMISLKPVGDIWKLKALNGQILKLRRNEKTELQKITQLFNDWLSGNNMAGLECDMRMNLLLNILINRHFPVSSETKNSFEIKHSRDIVSGALKYLSVNHDHRVTTAELSKALNVSASSLRSAFRSVMKRSLGDYERGQRMDAALRLLRSSTLDIGTIAAKTGFGSISSFARALRNEPSIGKTPLHVRREAAPGKK